MFENKQCGEDFITLTPTRQKRVCDGCPELNKCLSFAMKLQDYEDVVYGGMTGQERQELSKVSVW